VSKQAGRPRVEAVVRSCPFCGNQPFVERRGRVWLIFCGCVVGPRTQLYWRKRAALAAWNRRLNAHDDPSAASADRVGRVVGGES
jgi:hypothetical protein